MDSKVSRSRFLLLLLWVLGVSELGGGGGGGSGEEVRGEVAEEEGGEGIEFVVTSRTASMVHRINPGSPTSS